MKSTTPLDLLNIKYYHWISRDGCGFYTDRIYFWILKPKRSLHKNSYNQKTKKLFFDSRKNDKNPYASLILYQFEELFGFMVEGEEIFKIEDAQITGIINCNRKIPQNIVDRFQLLDIKE